METGAHGLIFPKPISSEFRALSEGPSIIRECLLLKSSMKMFSATEIPKQGKFLIYDRKRLANASLGPVIFTLSPPL
jgi:hypothetical protein